MVIWLWFKVENICDISIIMYNLIHCLLERYHLLVEKNSNSLFTGFDRLWLKNKIFFAYQPLHNLLYFLVTVQLSDIQLNPLPDILQVLIYQQSIA